MSSDRHYFNSYGERANPHLAIAMVAALLSFIGHLATIYLVADWRLDTVRQPQAHDDTTKTTRPPLRVERLFDDPQRPPSDPKRGDPHEGREGALPLEKIDELAHPPSAAFITPPSLSREALAGTLVSLQAPSRRPEALIWQPRQQILAVMERHVADELATLPRRTIPRIERVAKAPDYLPAVDLTRDRFSSDRTPPPKSPGNDNETTRAQPHSEQEKSLSLPRSATPSRAADLFGEEGAQINSYEALDDRLKATVESYLDKALKRRYFRVAIGRQSHESLPTVPKDIVFVQDSSRSLAEERLYLCRRALQEGLALLRPGDRFNVVAFSDSARFCFDGWASTEAESLERASSFISELRAEGKTDVFASMEALLKLPRDPSRPAIAILITDGRPTIGLLGSTAIIGAFTKLNGEGFSIFALGTQGSANLYLLDLLTYCNRGSANVVTSGRWDIPTAIQALIASVSDPILGNVAVTANIDSWADLNPIPPANLYLGRELEIYGSAPAEVTNLVLQAHGRGGSTKCDVIFNINLPSAERDNPVLREQWARRRMHTLIGEYAHQPTSTNYKAMERHSLLYRLPIPYRQEILEKTSTESADSNATP